LASAVSWRVSLRIGNQERCVVECPVRKQHLVAELSDDGAAAQAAARSRPAVVAAIKVVHTVAWLSIESCVAYVLWAGFAGRSDRRAGVAAAVVAGEMVVFAGSGFRCPLTRLAERYGAEHGSVTDIFLPKWFAHNMPVIHAPLLVLMTYLHARNLIGSHRAPETAGGGGGTRPRSLLGG
jgi:hypothetical protein